MESMCEKILRSIENILKNDLEIEDFTIVATDDNTRNKSPVLYEGHHLGLESWCVRYVYDYACGKLMKIRQVLAERKMSYSVKEDLNYLLIGALFINPDVGTFWNMRRELLEEDILNYDKEFYFSKLILSRKPKSNEAFSYRRWLINRITQKIFRNGVTPSITLLEVELSVCTQAADSTPNNYHAWTHRQWIISKLANFFPYVLPRELEMTESWISNHVSENSGYHYRQFLIGKLRNSDSMPTLMQYFDKVIGKLNILNDGECLQLLEYLLGKPLKKASLDNLTSKGNHIILLLYDLLIMIRSIDEIYIEHESLWLHRRYVIFHLLHTSYELLGECVNRIETNEYHQNKLSSTTSIINAISVESNGQRQAKIFKCQPSRFESSNMYNILVESERSFISKNITGNAIQKELAKRHEKWLKFILRFNLN